MATGKQRRDAETSVLPPWLSRIITVLALLERSELLQEDQWHVTNGPIALLGNDHRSLALERWVGVVVDFFAVYKRDIVSVLR